MEVVEELLEGGADPNQADEVRATLSSVCQTSNTLYIVGEQECTVLGM